MSINTDLLGYVSVDELLGEDAADLRIPDFQRPYSWTPRIAAQLFDDVRSALGPPSAEPQPPGQPVFPYILGTVILLKRPERAYFEVVDGQQRLLTLKLLRAALSSTSSDEADVGSTNSPIELVSSELSRRVADLGPPGYERDRYLAYLNEHTKILRIVTDDEDEAFQFFDSQNFRGKSLRPHDLLKAYHLREMADASPAEQRAVVEDWEKAGENRLNTLFGTYLARIYWWSRNLPARHFTADHIDIFKGVGRSAGLPGAEYHRAAKTILPGVQEWAVPLPDEPTRRDMHRVRHQLDTPVVSGKPFFSFAAFMLEEITRLDTELFTSPTSTDGSPRDLTDFRDAPRYRFCRELFIAAALSYTNKFSEADLPQARRSLFRWAYALRLGYERLGWRSADNYALGEETKLPDDIRLNLFAAIRDSLEPRDLRLEDVRVPDSASSGNNHDNELARLLRSGDF